MSSPRSKVIPIAVRVSAATVLVVILMGVPMIGRWGANLFDYDAIDPDGAFAWFSVHHIVQAAVILLAIALIRRSRPIDFHLGLGNREAGLRYLRRFLPFFALYTAGAFITVIAIGNFQPFHLPMTARNIAGYLGFQLLLSGPSEEIIFRAFAITLFSRWVTARRLHPRVSVATLFAAVVFGLAHVYITFNPFAASWSSTQVIYATALGYFYGDCYEQSGSVVYPMIMHSYTNVLMVSATIVVSLFI
ncbi:MAG: CPBP family intramembrane metalloprotease [Spirochaetaceae bacterium]|nr:MAG: CPBP family intramembrane metalloprotease [Spirochaetaceae bacterium]